MQKKLQVKLAKSQYSGSNQGVLKEASVYRAHIVFRYTHVVDRKRPSNTSSQLHTSTYCNIGLSFLWFKPRRQRQKPTSFGIFQVCFTNTLNGGRKDGERVNLQHLPKDIEIRDVHSHFFHVCSNKDDLYLHVDKELQYYGLCFGKQTADTSMWFIFDERHTVLQVSIFYVELNVAFQY